MFDHVLDYILTHGLLATLSVGIVPSVLFTVILILILKIIEMNKNKNYRVIETALKQQKKEMQKYKNKQLQLKLDEEADKIAAEGPVNHLHERVARIKAANEEVRNRNKK